MSCFTCCLPHFWARRRGRRKKKHGEAVTPLVVFSDPGQDLDDEMSYMMIRHLVSEELVEVRGIVTTLYPAFARARLARGTLSLLGLQGVPVGVGTDGGDTQGMHSASPFEDGARSYMPPSNSETLRMLEPGRRLLNRLFSEAEEKSLTVLIIASLKDVALFLRDNESLFEAKTKEVVIMGGVDSSFRSERSPSSSSRVSWGGSFANCELPRGQLLVPDSSHNQEFDRKSSEFFFRRCQELGIRLVVVSRWTAYAAKMPRETYDVLAATGSSIARRLRNAQRSSIEQLWTRAVAPAGSAQRKGLPERCNRQWFIDTFAGGQDDPARGADQPIWDLVDGFMQYDTIALLAAVPYLRDSFFNPVSVNTFAMNGQKTRNMVIGCSKEEPNVRESESLLDFMNQGFINGLALNHQDKAQIILIAQHGGDAYYSIDIMLACVMLRTLYELSVVECIGIVVTPAKDNESVATLPQQTSAIRRILDAVGLRFVAVHVAGDTAGAEEHLKRMYAGAHPMGVTLISIHTLTAAAAFVEHDPALYREKTSRTILLGSLVMDGSEDNTRLSPDPQAQNNRLDMPAANFFYARSQELSVPLVVLSRHFARAVQVPRVFFDVMHSHGGAVGRECAAMQKAQIEDLHRRACLPPRDGASRGDLPHRCDQAWFRSTFCNGRAQPCSSDLGGGIWDDILSFNVYSPLVLLAAIPAVAGSFLDSTPVPIRAATHQLVGLSAEQPGVKQPEKLQSLLLHGLLYGARVNVSEYDLGNPPVVPLGEVGSASTWRFDPSEVALMRLLPDRMLRHQLEG
eukprot:TRINITY_DN71339_c0_g1_i1.p1 TRINITY_DN71339_c0_g1~~TRINITY_DN71339_c0_g1_i1.p1  ORF type:complete len:826 (-),score=137.62 TRINITY_DN71339_c0_g1_i1:93-2483(-)